MNLKKNITLTVLLLTAVLLLCGCAEGRSHYDQLDTEGYTVSVKFDANGGIFTTNTATIVDSYDLSKAPVVDGKVRIALLSPDNAVRGTNAFTAVNNGYFLAGWYAERTESGAYSKKWDFAADCLELDPNGQYTASQPVLTLYAVWVPLFEVEIYDLHSGEYVNRFTFDPADGMEFTLPAWNRDTGAIDQNDFPKCNGYTYNGVYLDAEGTQPVTGETVTHPGAVDYASGVGQNTKLKLYVDFLEGEWFHIYNAEQFADNASVSGNYILHADLDFADVIWPTSLMYGTFSGSIDGNGHTMQNISITQNNNSKTNAGIFGSLADTACVENVNFRNITVTIKAGTRVAGASFGLFAGTISDGAMVGNVSITESQLQIHSDCYFGTNDYAIGLVCGMGNSEMVHSWDIQCVAVGDEPEKVIFAVDGNTVTLS